MVIKFSSLSSCSIYHSNKRSTPLTPNCSNTLTGRNESTIIYLTSSQNVSFIDHGLGCPEQGQIRSFVYYYTRSRSFGFVRNDI